MRSIRGEYEVLELLGRGSTGRVLKARHTVTGQLVALKVLHDDLVEDKEVRERFRTEAAVLAGRTLPNVVPMIGTVEDEHGLSLVLRLVDGRDLRQWLGA